MQTLLSHAFLYLFALSSLKSVQTLFTQNFDVFVSDWLKFLINIHEKSYNPRHKSSNSCSCEDVSQFVKLVGALEAIRETPAKEKVAPQFQPKVRVASQKIAFVH